MKSLSIIRCFPLHFDGNSVEQSNYDNDFVHTLVALSWITLYKLFMCLYHFYYGLTGVLQPLSLILHLYRDGQFCWWRKPRYTTFLTPLSKWQVTKKIISSTHRNRTHNFGGDRHWSINKTHVNPMVSFYQERNSLVTVRLIPIRHLMMKRNGFTRCLRIVYWNGIDREIGKPLMISYSPIYGGTNNRRRWASNRLIQIRLCHAVVHDHDDPCCYWKKFLCHLS